MIHIIYFQFFDMEMGFTGYSLFNVICNSTYTLARQQESINVLKLHILCIQLGSGGKQLRL